MSNRVALSVIVPVFNAETFLPEALDSLMKVRMDESYEIIAVDDGSSDSTLGILEAYQEKCPNVLVITQENGGVSRARNTGMETAEGKYITFADADDAVEPGFYRKAIEELETGRYDMVQGNSRYIVDGKLNAIRPGCSRRESADPEEQMEWFFGREEILTYSVWSKVYRRELIENVRFAPGIRVAEDQKFLFDVLLRRPRVLVLDIDAYNYVIRETSVMHSRYAELGWEALSVLEDCGKAVEYPSIRKHIQKRKTDVLVRIYNTAKVNGQDTGKVLAAIRATDVSALQGELTKKERVKLELLQKCPAAYDALLKIAGTAIR